MDCSARGDLVLDSFLGSGTTSAVLAFLIVNLAGWDRNALYAETLGLGGFAFGVLSNAVFLGASIRNARALYPGLHLGGFPLGIAAALALLFLYALILL